MDEAERLGSRPDALSISPDGPPHVPAMALQGSPSTLRTYAAILEKPRRVFDEVVKRTITRHPGEIMVAAATALRFHADAIERSNNGQSINPEK